MKIAATFADGLTVEIKNSKRSYGVAWRVTVEHPDGRKHGYTGFARDATLAERSARSEVRHMIQDGWKLAGVEVVATVREG